MNCRVISKELVNIHASGQTIFSFSYIEGITLGAGVEVNEIAVGVSGMCVGTMGEVGDGTNCWFV